MTNKQENRYYFSVEWNNPMAEKPSLNEDSGDEYDSYGSSQSGEIIDIKNIIQMIWVSPLSHKNL